MNLPQGSFRDYARAVLQPSRLEDAASFQFFCDEHDYGWSITEDGIDNGCHECRKAADGICRCADCEADRIDAAYELSQELDEDTIRDLNDELDGRYDPDDKNDGGIPKWPD